MDPNHLTPAPPAPAAPPAAPPALATAADDGAPPPAGYDPADYRWVPVRRRPRLDGWTEEKQRRFIEVLADTGQVRLAAKAVGMSRESAYRLRRSAHGAAFARAWDAARHHAGSLIEDVAFERALEGVDQEVFDASGDVVGAKRVYSDRLLTFLLRHLKPERYGLNATVKPATGAPADPSPTVDATLREMEPRLPAPPEALMEPDTLATELLTADIADGVLPRFWSEQRSPEAVARAEAAARHGRGRAAWDKLEAGGKLDDAEFADMCAFIDPASAGRRHRTDRDADWTSGNATV